MPLLNEVVHLVYCGQKQREKCKVGDEKEEEAGGRKRVSSSMRQGMVFE